MQPPKNFEQVVKQKRYSTATATLLAGDDAQGTQPDGRNTFLYRTPNGAYFEVSVFEKGQPKLFPLTREDAIALYQGPLSKHRVPYAQAFPPGVEDA